MRTWEDENGPEDLTPTRDLLLGSVLVVMVFAIGIACGWIMGTERAWIEMERCENNTLATTLEER